MKAAELVDDGKPLVMRLAELVEAEGGRAYLSGWVRGATGPWQLQFELEYVTLAAAKAARRRFLAGKDVVDGRL
jgi:hypothetical protein